MKVCIFSDAALAAAIKVTKRPDMAARIFVSILPRFAKCYPSTKSFDGLN